MLKPGTICKLNQKWYDQYLPDHNRKELFRATLEITSQFDDKHYLTWCHNCEDKYWHNREMLCSAVFLEVLSNA